MTGTTRIVRALLERELESFVHEVERFPDDEMPWRTVPGITNSAGNLAIHVAGNLQHYIGARLGGTGYVRNRPNEFSQRFGSRAEVVAELRRAMAVVGEVMPTLGDDVLGRPFPEAVGGVTPETGPFLFHLVSHTAFHLGQAGYLRRTLTGASESTHPLPIAKLPTSLPTSL